MSSPSSVHDNQSPNQCPGQSSQPSALDSKGKSVESVAINPASSQIRPVRTTSTENPTIDTSFSDFEEELDESATSLGTSVFVSATVGATILAAFLSLAEDVTRKRGQDFEIAMFFCFLAGTCYVSNVLVCGRTLILAFEHKPSRRSSTDRKEHSKRMEAVFRVQQLCDPEPDFDLGHIWLYFNASSCSVWCRVLEDLVDGNGNTEKMHNTEDDLAVARKINRQ
ncbi:hypothetical protein AGABI2DRAFT_120630 [Agaricus bisporus var. bisporus H97]|uniref:hypothetical protein n=1 Tax=Agaricus bisporus var. bisporus (strain H97 / ATCC MYA-4626 / FGSC 10389) TaxID=936046 RepID=UPI00029F7B41|nr:hypothetical protein AGABI2DRAFT_120630 [Agaricus bisporus var. bisporus H97]EKV44509.1 hypothetical protein AGABI2DRAFT_120630 [Agaricus bisporus var. bisporus H97]